MVGAEGFEPPTPLLPKQMRYQTALRPDTGLYQGHRAQMG